MSFNFALEFDFDPDIEELSAALAEEQDYLRQDLAHFVQEAGDAAVAEMQANHPYTDRTFCLSGGMSARLGRVTKNTAEVVIRFQAKYAAAVNYGGEYSRPFPFVPQGMEAAEKALIRCAEEGLDRFCQAIGRR